MKEKNAIVFGILAGLLVIGYHIGMYALNKEFVIHPAFFYGVYFWYFICMIPAGLRTRSSRGGLLDYKSALRTCFITFLIAAVFYYAIYYTLFNYDPELVVLQKKQFIEGIEWQYEQGYMKDEQYADTKKSYETADFSVNVKSIFLGIPFHIIGGFLVSCLASLLVKR